MWRALSNNFTMRETFILALVLTPTLVMVLSWEALVVTLTPTSNLVLGFTIALITALAVPPTGYGRVSTTLAPHHTHWQK